MVINHLLNGMILQVHPPNSGLEIIVICPEQAKDGDFPCVSDCLFGGFSTDSIDHGI